MWPGVLRLHTSPHRQSNKLGELREGDCLEETWLGWRCASCRLCPARLRPSNDGVRHRESGPKCLRLDGVLSNSSNI